MNDTLLGCDDSLNTTRPLAAHFDGIVLPRAEPCRVWSCPFLGNARNLRLLQGANFVVFDRVDRQLLWILIFDYDFMQTKCSVTVQNGTLLRPKVGLHRQH